MKRSYSGYTRMRETTSSIAIARKWGFHSYNFFSGGLRVDRSAQASTNNHNRGAQTHKTS